ncbi:histidine triad nucleotide-binding protein [Poseidonibacter lekithochrous]|uniref:histidine triad nucleotide-binding protein n=1 Tax=Poseidonibacter lekithochrous TaxID=1904463 RepID=UPI0008FC7296|nr:histidine triad nucleotide-binding protein [Poseidonibacter lekithochrous]QKJ21748.1 histidine triad nucleotide-binding protein, Hint/PKCI branch [Poseidonibacter lekithochrous]
MVTNDCIFCKIVKGDIPNQTVLEDENFLAFNDINPTRKIHVLIIPKEHYDSFDVIPPKIMAGMTEFIQKVASKLKVKESGYRLITNIGNHGGQEVPHLHFHLLAGEYAGRLVGEQRDKQEV